MLHIRRAAIACGFAAAMVSFRPTLAQEDAFSEKVDVRVINIEAVVEDAQGNRVRGLEGEDFEILVDGQARPADYFTEIQDGLMPPPAASEASPPGIEGLLASPGDASETSPRRLPNNYLVFIDMLLSDPREARYAAERLAADLERLPPEDQVSVFVFDGARLHRLADWSSGREGQLSALRQLHLVRSEAAGAIAETIAADAMARLLTDDATSASVLDSAKRLGWRLDATLTAAAAAMRAASPPPGRRVMLAFGGNWPRDFAAFFGVATSPEFSKAVRNCFPRASYQGLYEAANQLGYTLYTTDLFLPRALRGLDDRDFERNVTFGKFADETGGRSFQNGWKRGALDEIRDDLASFYWLGFDAPRRHDGKSYKLEVRVKQPGLKVRSRRQFSDQSRQAEIEQELAGRLLFENGAEGRQDFKVTTGEPREKGGEITLPVSLRIPLEEVFFEPRGKAWRAELELRIAALDERGGRSPMPSIPVKLDGPKPQPGQYATYETALRLRRESKRFVLGLYDAKTSRLLVSTVKLAGF
jgi:VWFA-related protein